MQLKLTRTVHHLFGSSFDFIYNHDLMNKNVRNEIWNMNQLLLIYGFVDKFGKLSNYFSIKNFLPLCRPIYLICNTGNFHFNFFCIVGVIFFVNLQADLIK